jgi:hypothetical protein
MKSNNLKRCNFYDISSIQTFPNFRFVYVLIYYLRYKIRFSTLGIILIVNLNFIVLGATIITPSADIVHDDRARPVVVGGSNFDFVCRVTEPELRLDGSTLFGNIRSFDSRNYRLSSIIGSP